MAEIKDLESLTPELDLEHKIPQQIGETATDETSEIKQSEPQASVENKASVDTESTDADSDTDSNVLENEIEGKEHIKSMEILEEVSGESLSIESDRVH